MEQDILKYALWNSIKFKGKANPNAVLGKILSENVEARQNKEKVLTQINKVIEKVNKMSLEDQQKLLKEI